MSAVETRRDLVELRNLHTLAARPGVRQILAVQIEKLEAELNDLNAQADVKESSDVSSRVSRESSAFDVKITNYAWDQSEKFVKFYVTLPGVHLIPAENVKTAFAERKMELRVLALENKNHNLTITNLMKDIMPADSYHKVKADTVVVFLRKAGPASWSHVTELEKRAKEAKAPKPDMEDSDPGASLMNMMKQMYNEGDDEMKRTIAKAWTEARDKQNPGGDLGF
ncbi:calcyclin-binding protein-like [Ornithodoros turicata]